MSQSAYKVVEIIGASDKSWEDAARVAIERASRSLSELRIAEVVEQDIRIEDGKPISFRTRLRLSFKYKD